MFTVRKSALTLLLLSLSLSIFFLLSAANLERVRLIHSLAVFLRKNEHTQNARHSRTTRVRQVSDVGSRRGERFVLNGLDQAIRIPRSSCVRLARCLADSSFVFVRRDATQRTQRGAVRFVSNERVIFAR